MRSDLEREMASRQTLQLQMESKEQLVNSLKSQLESTRGSLGSTLGGTMMSSGGIDLGVTPKEPNKDLVSG